MIKADAVFQIAPSAEAVAALRMLNFKDLCAVVGELHADERA